MDIYCIKVRAKEIVEKADKLLLLAVAMTHSRQGK